MKALYGEKRERQFVTMQMKSGKKVAEIFLGDALLVHRYFFQTSYIAYQDIERIYMQVAGGEFGEFPIDEYSLMIEDRDGKEHKLHVDRPEYIQEIIRWMAQNHPEIKTGKKKV